MLLKNFETCLFFSVLITKLKHWYYFGKYWKLKLCCLQFLPSKIKISINVLLCPEELNLFPTYNEQLMPDSPVSALFEEVNYSNSKQTKMRLTQNSCFSRRFFLSNFNQIILKLKYHGTPDTVKCMFQYYFIKWLYYTENDILLK